MQGSRTYSGKGRDRARKRYQAEEIIGKLRAIEVPVAKGLKAEEAAWKEEIAEQTCLPLAAGVRGLKIDQAKRLKELERKNARLEKLLAEAHRDKAMLQEVVPGRLQQCAALKF